MAQSDLSLIEYSHYYTPYISMNAILTDHTQQYQNWHSSFSLESHYKFLLVNNEVYLTKISRQIKSSNYANDIFIRGGRGGDLGF